MKLGLIQHLKTTVKALEDVVRYEGNSWEGVIKESLGCPKGTLIDLDEIDFGDLDDDDLSDYSGLE